MDQYATDELTLAQKVIPALGKGMLCLADRFFPSYKLWRMAAKTGADLLWRTRQNARLDVEKGLPDGSYLSRIYASTSDRRNRRNGIVVRVIDYRLKDVKDAEPIYRLITTILDHEQAPAKELAALYHERWEIETALDELKTHLRGAQIVLRSKTPELVKQEFSGLLMRNARKRGTFCYSRSDARSCPEGGRGSRPAFLFPCGARCPSAHAERTQAWAATALFPLSTRKPCMKRFSTRSSRSAWFRAGIGSNGNALAALTSPSESGLLSEQYWS
ncbi:MAG: IS4 family transposase [Bryobacteraceae bacterium]